MTFSNSNNSPPAVQSTQLQGKPTKHGDNSLHTGLHEIPPWKPARGLSTTLNANGTSVFCVAHTQETRRFPLSAQREENGGFVAQKHMVIFFKLWCYNNKYISSSVSSLKQIHMLQYDNANTLHRIWELYGLILSIFIKNIHLDSDGWFVFVQHSPQYLVSINH